MYKNKKIVALIPARKGSKGIKNKNIINLMGKPLISYSIKYAESSNLIDKIFVSTDGNKIASISKKFGAEVIIRPRNISGDTVPNEPVISHALNYIKKIGFNFDIVVFLQPTSPLRKSMRLIKQLNY